MEGFTVAASLLPPELRRAAMALPERSRGAAEELRLRRGRLPTALLPEGERPLPASRPVSGADLDAVLENATCASAHSAEDSIRRGYVTSAGGCRVGLCGEAAAEGGSITGLRALSSVSLRVPREVRGCADGVYRELAAGGFSSTLLLSPPGAGKTTLLRELIRLLSESGERVCVADERGEIAAVTAGEPRFELGPLTDVLSGAPKAEGAMLLLRAMNPRILAMDEITAQEDLNACRSCALCGVELLATVHAADARELAMRPLCRELLSLGVFRRAVVISRAGGVRKYEVTPL